MPKPIQTGRWIDLPESPIMTMAGAVQFALVWLIESGIEADGTTMVRYTDALGQRMVTYV